MNLFVEIMLKISFSFKYRSISYKRNIAMRILLLMSFSFKYLIIQSNNTPMKHYFELINCRNVQM